MGVIPYAAQKPQLQFALQQFPFFQFTIFQLPLFKLQLTFLFELFQQEQFLEQEQFILFQRTQFPFVLEQEQRAEIPVRLL